MQEIIEQSISPILPVFKSPGNIDSISDIFGILINVAIGVTFALSMVGMAYAFFQFTISRGDKDAVKNAKSSLTWSAIALVVSLLAVAIKTILYRILGTQGMFYVDTPGF
jgi:hypothetical protein